MIDFFKSQMDYIYFLYGLGFFSLATVCFLLVKTHDKKLRWFWLGLFGLVHAVNEWLDLFALMYGDGSFFKLVRLAFLAVSFLFLFEFGRASFNILHKKKVPSFVYIFLFILLFMGWHWGGTDGLGIVSRYCLGFCGSCFVALVFFISAYQGEKGLKTWRIVAGITFFSYGLTQLVIAKGHVFIPPFLTQEVFLKNFHFPIQLARTILAFVSSFMLWSYWYLTWGASQQLTLVKRDLGLKKILYAALILFVAIVLGWFVIEGIGHRSTLQDEDKFLSRAETAAAAINPRSIKHLTASSSDLDQLTYSRLREQLKLVKKANKDLRFVYLMVSKKGQIVFLLDSEPEQSPDYSPPGQIYEEASPLLKRNFSNKNSFIIGPYQDRWGTWISAFSPIKDVASDTSVAVLGMDINHGLWQRQVFKNRSTGIFIVFSFFVILICGFILIELSRLATARFSQANMFLELMMNSIPNPVYYKNKEGVYLGCNDAFGEFFGCSRKDIIGKTVFDLMPEETARKFYKEDLALIKTLGVQVIDSKVTHADGSVRDLIVSKSSFTDMLGEASGIIGVYVDITERRRAELALKKSLDEISDLYNNAPCGYHSLDENGVFVRINDTELQWLGYEKEEVLGKKKFSDCVAPANLEIFKINFPILKERGWLKNVEIDIVRKDGTIFSALLNCVAIKDEKGHFLMSRSTVFDVTEHKKVQADLLEKEEQFRAIYEGSSDAMMILGDKKFLGCNPQTLKIFGFDSIEEFISRSPGDVSPATQPDGRDSFLAAQEYVQKAFQEGRTQFEWVHQRKNGEVFSADVLLSAFRYLGQYVLQATVRDITENKKLEEDREKFLYNMNERMKELNCLYGISKIVEKPGISLEGIFQEVVELFPSAYQYSEIACARIVFENSEFKTDNFKITEWKLSSDIKVDEKKVGVVEVCYLKDRPQLDKGPFLNEEKKLIDAAAERLGRIVERKRLQELVFSEKERLSVTLSSIGDGVIATDVEGKVILVNKAAEVLTGWRQDEAFGQFSSIVFHIISEVTRELCKNPFQEVLRTGEVMELENHTVLIAKNGEERVIADSGAPIHDRAGKIIGAVLVFRDITKEKKMLDDLKAAEKEWQRTFDAIADILFIQDKDFNIVKVNRACLDALKLSEDQIIGKKCYEILHHAGHPWPNCPFAQTRVDQKVHTEEVDDPVIGVPLLVTTSPIFKEDGNFYGSIHIAKDISVIKKYQHELEKKNKDLEQLDQLKSDFISIVSHELRTPLAITKEGISLVLDGVTGEINVKQRKILKLSKDGMDRLARLINDLLDISKIESGRVQLLRKSTDLVKLAEKVLGDFSLKAREKKLKIALNTKTPEVVLNIDEDRIIQVFVNLIGNAMKFTEAGSVEVSLDDDGDEVRCVVADTGRGIAEKDLPKVFDKFVQFGRTAGGGEKGTGLGLSIAKGLVELHNGKMWVESEFGKGTRFIFIIPRKTTMERVREHIEKAIGVAIKDSAEFSLIVVTLSYSDKIRGEQRESGLMELADQMEKVFRKRIYRQKDSVLNCLDKFFIILGDCNKPNSSTIRDRLAQELEEFLKSKNLGVDVKVDWQITTFPDDGNTYQSLIEKVE